MKKTCLVKKLKLLKTKIIARGIKKGTSWDRGWGGKGLSPVGSIKGLEKRIVFLENKIAATSFPVVNNTHENEGENTKFFTID